MLVDKLAPDCRTVGRFHVRGRAGRNVVRFDGRVGQRRLDAGTYRVTAHPRGRRSRPVAGVTVAVLDRPGATAAAAATRNTCSRGTLPSGASLGSAAGSGGEKAKAGVAGVQITASRRPYTDEAAGPLNQALGTISAAADAVPPVLIALAALAVLLLGVGSMPAVRTSRTGAALVHHRATITLAGVGVLAAAVLAFLVS